ncbi:MAG TPA: hypothetical protein VFU36_15880 [Jatrophihabitans sp.]|nr:hypothetical protein [Jatrophihabitans sp.]
MTKRQLNPQFDEAKKRAALEAQRRREQAELEARRQRELMQWRIAAISRFQISVLELVRAARLRGDRFLQLEIPRLAIDGGASTFSAEGNYLNQSALLRSPADRPNTDLLAAIEDAGWRLEHASFSYVSNPQTSGDRFTAGQQLITHAEVVGVYLFRAVPASG